MQEKRKKERETEDGKVGMRSRARRNSGDSIRVSYDIGGGEMEVRRGG